MNDIEVILMHRDNIMKVLRESNINKEDHQVIREEMQYLIETASKLMSKYQMA